MNKVNSTAFVPQEEMAKSLYALDLAALRTKRNTNEEKRPWERAGIPLVVDDNKIYVDDTDSHTVIFGSTGSKKTRMFVMPGVEMLSRAGESFFVADPKGEVHKRTVAGVKSRDYDVNCLNLRDFSKGKGWNPFVLPYDLYHSGNRSKAFELVGDIANVLFKTESDNDFFWASTALNVMTGFILLMFEIGDKEDCNLKNLIELWKEYRTDSKRFLARIREEFRESIIYTKICALDTSSDKTNGSIESYVDMGMNRLAINEEFVEYLSKSDIDFYDMARKKTATYLIVPDESEYYHFVVGLFVKQFYMVLVQQALDDGGSLKSRMNFILDEFCNIPEIPEFSNMITAARSRNIRFCLIVQSKKQLIDKYREKADVITGNCNNWIYLYSREMPLLSEISQLCGEVLYDNSIHVPLISTFDLQHLSKEKGEALLLVGRSKPCIANLWDIDEYPFSKEDEYEIQRNIEETPKEETYHEKDIDTLQENIPLSIFNSNTVKDAYVVKESYKQNQKPRRFEYKQWLVATYQGMIIDSAIVDSKDISSRYAFALMQARNELLFEQRKHIKWYYADIKTAEFYHNVLTQHPEYVFLTMNEVGKRQFTSLEDSEGYEDLDITDDIFNTLFNKKTS